MSVLKLKALIYKYSGLYLAHKEESEYLQSKEFWKSMLKLMNGKDKDLAIPRNAQGLLIGLWQCKHGFHRPLSHYWGKRPKWVFATLNWVIVLCITLKWDIKACLRKKSD